MRRLLIFLMIFLLLLSTGAAVTVDGQEIAVQDIDMQELDQAIQEYNENYVDQVPGLVKSIVSGERVNVNISTKNDNVVFGAVMDGMKITRVEEGGIADPTLIVYTSTDTLQAIAEADNPRERAVQAFKEDGIRYETVGFFRSVKFGVVSTLIKIFG